MTTDIEFDTEISDNINSDPRCHSQVVKSQDLDASSVRDSLYCDITAENWFQNERNGSLDEDTLELVQQQLLSRETMFEMEMASSKSSTRDSFADCWTPSLSAKQPLSPHNSQ